MDMNKTLRAFPVYSRPLPDPSGSGNSASILSFQRHTQKRVQQGLQMDAKAGKQDMPALMSLIAHQRDRSAFIQVYEYFSPRVKSFLLGKNLTPQLADEVLQEVMLAVWQKAHLYSPEKAAVSTWIFTIARNKHVDRIRQDRFPELDAEDPSLRPADVEEVEGECFAMERTQAVQQALSGLPKDQYEVIYMSFMQGISHGDIGERLGLPLGTVKSRIRLGFKRLRQELMELGAEI
jgi:RNA polymerase sigma-70 factor (ECF subfamily)